MNATCNANDLKPTPYTMQQLDMTRNRHTMLKNGSTSGYDTSNLDLVTPVNLDKDLEQLLKIQGLIKNQAPKQIKMGGIISEASYSEYMKGRTVQRKILYIPMTRGCEWRRNGSSGCFNCGMAVGAGVQPLSSAIINSVGKKILELKSTDKKFDWFNIYNEGSFLNDSEIPQLAQETILKLIATETDARRITIETRPEYITDAKVDMLNEIATEYDIELEIGIGLETSDDFIRKYCVNKGFTFDEFAQKAKILRKNKNIRVLAYHLFKPIFLNESEAISDAVESLHAYSGVVDAVSLEIAGVQEYTILEYLWLRKDYTLPSLWSVIEVLNRFKYSSDLEIRLGGEPNTYYPASKTTAHNCEKCSERIWKRIRLYNETHNPKVLEDSYCDCRENWISQVEEESNEIFIENNIAKRLQNISKNLSLDDYLEKKSLNSLLEVV